MGADAIQPGRARRVKRMGWAGAASRGNILLLEKLHSTVPQPNTGKK